MLFLYRLKNTEDRDACAYIDEIPSTFDCEHYFSGVIIQGACYYGGEFASYEDIETILTKIEYKKLIKFNEDIKKLGYGISKGDERYNKGIQLIKDIQPIYDKLQSEKAEKFEESIMYNEKEIMMDMWNLSEDDAEEILDNYRLDYKDRSIIGYIYDDVEDLAENEIEQCFNVPDYLTNYIDYSRFGEDLLQDTERYKELEDGRVVCYNN